MKLFLRNWRRCAVASAALVVASSAFGGDPKVIFSIIATSPTAVVPGSGGAELFKPDGSNYIDSGTSEMQARILWIPTQDIDAGDGWTESVDVVSFAPLQ